MPSGVYKRKVGILAPRWGSRHSEESKRKMREAALRNGNKPPSRKGVSFKMSEEQKEKIRATLTGVRHTSERKLKQRLAKLGKKRKLEHEYATSLHEQIRKSDTYKLWRKSVFERDDYTCVECGAKNGFGKTITLNADHIKPFSLFPELRFDLSNGRTLCVPCHRETPTYGFKLKKLAYVS